MWITLVWALTAVVQIELSSINLGLEVEVLLCLERFPVADEEEQIVRLHAGNLLYRHELLTLLRVRKTPPLVRCISSRIY